MSAVGHDRVRAADSHTVTLDGRAVTLPAEANAKLVDVIRLLESGVDVRITPVEEFVSTREAAHLLGVSRPTLIRLLDQGLIEFDQPGVHRRVSRVSLEAYIASRRHRRRGGLSAMAETYEDADLWSQFMDDIVLLDACILI